MRKCLLGLLACALTLGGLTLVQSEAQAGPRYVRHYHGRYYRPYYRPYWGGYYRPAPVVVTPSPVYVQPVPVYVPPTPVYVPVQPVTPTAPVLVSPG